MFISMLMMLWMCCIVHVCNAFESNGKFMSKIEKKILLFYPFRSFKLFLHKKMYFRHQIYQFYGQKNLFFLPIALTICDHICQGFENSINFIKRWTTGRVVIDLDAFLYQSNIDFVTWFWHIKLIDFHSLCIMLCIL